MRRNGGKENRKEGSRSRKWSETKAERGRNGRKPRNWTLETEVREGVSERVIQRVRELVGR